VWAAEVAGRWRHHGGYFRPGCAANWGFTVTTVKKIVWGLSVQSLRSAKMCGGPNVLPPFIMSDSKNSNLLVNISLSPSDQLLWKSFLGRSQIFTFGQTNREGNGRIFKYLVPNPPIDCLIFEQFWNYCECFLFYFFFFFFLKSLFEICLELVPDRSAVVCARDLWPVGSYQHWGGKNITAS
jgi:hypothetical protein